MQRAIALSTALVSVTLMCLMAIHGTLPASAGEATPNVTGKWEGTYDGRGRFGTGPITFHLRQEGNKVTGKQSVVDLIPVWGHSPTSAIVVEEEIRDGEIDGSTLHFHVNTEGVQGELNFTITVSGDTMTGTICGYNCGKLKLKKAPM